MITIPSQIVGFQTLKDGTMKVTLETNELNPEQSLAIFSLVNKLVYAGFELKPFEDEEMGLLDSMESDFEDNIHEYISKTQARRLGSVFYILFKQDNKGYEDFRDYYKHETNKIIKDHERQIKK